MTRPTSTYIERDKRIAEDRVAGLQFRELGAKYGLTAQRCKQICDALNVPLRPTPRRIEWRDLNCEGCGTAFKAPPDHGAWPRFCSRECYFSKCLRPIRKPCIQCGVEFLAGRHHHKPGEYSVYCSKACAAEGQRRRINFQCEACGEMSFKRVSQVTNRKNLFCSKPCQVRYLRGERAAAYKGGSYIGSDGVRYIHVMDLGIWKAEHRIVAAQILGRDLRYWDEPIIHLNGDMADNRPGNLYVFPSYEEMGKCLMGQYGTYDHLISNISPPPIYRGV